MITLVFDRNDYKRNKPYPNGWHNYVYDFADTIDGDNFFDVVFNNHRIASAHSELFGSIRNGDGNYVYLKNINPENYNGDLLFYPIEVYGNHRVYIEDANQIVDIVSKKAIELAKLNKLVFVFNLSHEPFSDMDFIQKFNKQIESVNLKQNNFIFFGGSSNLLELYPELKNTGYTFYFEDNLLTSSSKKIEELKNNPSYILKYKSEWLNISDIDVKRNKHFVCPNRNSNKKHRFTLGCFFESENLWDKLYCSFLETLFIPWEEAILPNLDYDFFENLKPNINSFVNKLPIQMDTELIGGEELRSFESMRSFKKEIYLDSYINIVTESSFINDIFPTEKLLNPITVLQPFIIVSMSGYLQYIKNLGFKTFSPFIDESYDEEKNDAKRLQMICFEIKRLSKLSLEEIHDWYISIIPILEYNRNHAMQFAKRNMFTNNLNKYKNGIYR